jgi:hypothetical protein
MSTPNGKAQAETEVFQDAIVISSTVEEIATPLGKVGRICWNTGEQKNCSGCYLSKGCKARE